MAIEGVSGTGLEAQSSQTDAVKSLIRRESPHPLSIAGVNQNVTINSGISGLTPRSTAITGCDGAIVYGENADAQATACSGIASREAITRLASIRHAATTVAATEKVVATNPARVGSDRCRLVRCNIDISRSSAR